MDLRRSLHLHIKNTTALKRLSSVSRVTSVNDRQSLLLLLFLDLSAAFYTVHHAMLLKRRCTRFGLRGKVLTCGSHLLQNVHSLCKLMVLLPRCVLFGTKCPKALCLGHYYTYCIQLPCMHGVSFPLYAGDTQLYTIFAYNDDQDLTVKYRPERRVVDINKRTTSNKLKLNNGKSERLLPHSRFRHSLRLSSLQVGARSNYSHWEIK